MALFSGWIHPEVCCLPGVQVRDVTRRLVTSVYLLPTPDWGVSGEAVDRSSRAVKKDFRMLR